MPVSHWSTRSYRARWVSGARGLCAPWVSGAPRSYCAPWVSGARGLTVLAGFCCSEFYEANALMMEEEGAIIAGLLVGLNVIDANFCMKGEDLDSQVWEILL